MRSGLCGLLHLAALVLVSGCGTAQRPNYALGATAKCLRAANYVVVRGDKWAPKPRGPQSRWIIISNNVFAYLGAYFAPNAAAASAWANSHVGEGTEVDRNVAFDIGGNNDDVGDDIRACLRT
jgi:hypothetical protein